MQHIPDNKRKGNNSYKVRRQKSTKTQQKLAILRQLSHDSRKKAIKTVRKLKHGQKVLTEMETIKYYSLKS